MDGRAWTGLLMTMIGAARPGDQAPVAGPFDIDGDRRAAILWQQQFASRNDDWVNDLLPLRNGNVMAVGFLNRLDGSPPSDWSALAAQLTPEGRLVRQNSYGEGGGIDAFWSMAEASDGRRMFAGFTTRIGGGGINGYTLLATGDGAILRENGFGGGGYDRFTDVAATDGGYVFLGHSQPPGQDKRRVFLVKTDLDGLPLWERVHDAPESWAALYIESAPGGGFIVAGGTTVGDDGDMFAMKVDADGREMWRKRVGTPQWDEVNHGLVVRPDGSILLAGYAHRRGEETNDLVAATLSANGEVQRIERFGGQGDDRTILAKADSVGRVWIVGHTASAGRGGVDLLLARLDAKGSFEPAALTLGGQADDHGTALLPLDDGSLMLGGYSRGLGGGGQDAFVMRIAAPAWTRPNPAFRREVAKLR